MQANLDAQPLTAAGKPAATILRSIADELDAELIVLGAAHHTAPGGALGARRAAAKCAVQHPPTERERARR